MSDIPTDVFREITRRLPMDTVFCLRSVCKAWRQAIDDPDFAKTRGFGDDYLIIKDKTGKVFLLSMHHMMYRRKPNYYVEAINVSTIFGRPNVPKTYFPLPSCNGLILISTCLKKFVWLVWNPFTGEHLEIPQCPEIPNYKFGYSYTPFSGIGYDEANDDYKVVRIVQQHTFIYSLNSKSWRSIEGFPDCDISMQKKGVFTNGVLHWVGYTNEYVSKGCIVALDLSTETYRKILLPSYPFEDGTTPSTLALDALGESLFLSCIGDDIDFNVVWMMEYGCENTWIKVISLRERSPFHINRPIAYLKSKGQVLVHIRRNEFLWVDVKKIQYRYRFVVHIKPDVNDKIYDCIYDESYQVLPASFVRLNKSDGAYKGVTPEQTKKRKRASQTKKRKMASQTQRLGLTLIF